MYVKFAWRYFKAKKSANAINIIAWVTVSVIAFATCCQVLVLSVFNGFEDLVRSLYSSFYSDVRISPVTGKTLILPADTIHLIKTRPFIASVALVIEDKALLQNGEAQTVVNLKGVDNNFSKVTGVANNIVLGDYAIGTADDPGLVMGLGIQNATGISINPAFQTEPVTLILPKKTKSNNPLESISEGNITGTGVFAIQQDFDNQYAITNIDFVKNLLHASAEEYSALEIKLKHGQNINTCKKELQKLLGSRYLVQTKYEQNTNLYRTMRTEKWAIFAVLTLILIIAAFNMISALTMLVLEKKQDIAILQSMGATQGKIRKIFLSEGFLLGILGAATGITLAVIICLLQLKYKIIPLVGGSFLIDYFPVKLIWIDFVLVALTTLIITFLASWIPAYKAAKQPFQLH